MKCVLTVAGKLIAAVGLAVLSWAFVAGKIVNYPTVRHPFLGRIPEPGAHFVWRIEGNGSGTWTSNGLRSATFNRPGRRLLLLGDSFAEGLQVKDNEHFGQLIGEHFAERGSDWQTGTAGKSGYSTADYVAKADMFRELYRPNWVMIVVRDGDFGSDAWRKRLAGYAHFETNSVEKLIARDLPYADAGMSAWASDRARPVLPLFLLVANRTEVIHGWLRDNEQPWFRADRDPAILEGGEDLTRYPVDREMELLRGSYPARLTLVYLPGFDPKNLKDRTTNEILLEEAARRAGIEFLSLRGRYHELEQAGHFPYGFSNTRVNEGHLNRYGHAALANLILRHVEEGR